MQKIEKSQIYHNLWTCAYRRRYNAKVSKDWKLYDREHSTIVMYLNITKWWKFDSESKKYL